MGTSAIIDRLAALLEWTPPFHRLSQEDRQQILGDVPVEYFGPDEVVSDQGWTAHDFLYVGESGSCGSWTPRPRF